MTDIAKLLQPPHYANLEGENERVTVGAIYCPRWKEDSHKGGHVMDIIGYTFPAASDTRKLIFTGVRFETIPSQRCKDIPTTTFTTDDNHIIPIMTCSDSRELQLYLGVYINYSINKTNDTLPEKISPLVNKVLASRIIEDVIDKFDKALYARFEKIDNMWTAEI